MRWAFQWPTEAVIKAVAASWGRTLPRRIENSKILRYEAR